MKKIILLLGILLMVGIVHATDIITFNDSTSTGNITFDGITDESRFLNIPINSNVSNAFINLTGLNITTNTTNNYTEKGNLEQSTGYTGRFVCDAGVTNPTNADDADNASYANCAGAGQDIFWFNFSLPNVENITNVVLFARWDMVGGVTRVVSCVNRSNGGIINLLVYSGLGLHNDVVDVNPYCYDYENLSVEYQIATAVAGAPTQFYEVAQYVNYSNTTYPLNLTIELDGVEVYNNNSLFDGNHIFNFTSYLDNPILNFPTNLTFKSLNPGNLQYSEIDIHYSTNETIKFNSELNDKLYNAGFITLNRILNNETWDQFETNTGIVATSNIGESGIIDLEYYDNVSLFPVRHFYYYNDPAVTYNFTLYVVNKTNITQVLFTLYRENNRVLEGYYIAVQKKFLATNEFKTVEMHQTDFNGQSLLNVDLFDSTYRFLVYDTNLNLVYTSGATEIKSTSITLTINIAEDVFESLVGIQGMVIGSPFYNNLTNQFVAYVEDNTGIMNYSDLKTLRRTLLGDTIICNNRTFTSGFIYCTVPNPNLSGIFISTLTIETTTNGSLANGGTAEYSNQQVTEKTNNAGIFATILLTIGITALGFFNPAVAILLAIVGVVFGVMTKIFYISIGMVFTIVILGGILIFKMRT